MRPRFAPAPEFGVGGWNCVWFQVLKTSPRSSSLTSSRGTTNDFCAPISQVLTPGPLSTVGPLNAKETHCWNQKAFCIKPEKPVLSNVAGELAVASVANTVGKRVEEGAASLIWSA
jgi:hypothetical protein